MVVEAKQRLDDNQENQCLDVILNLLYIAGLWHKQDTRLYFIYRCFIMFMYLHFFVLMGHVFLNEDIDGIIDNAGHLFTFIPTGCLIFSLLKQRDTYSQVIQHIQTTFSHEGADSKVKRAIISSSIRREKELTKWYCTALTVAIGAYDVLPLTGLTFTTVGDKTYIHGSLPINTWSPFDRSIPLVFALEYVYQCCCASFIVFMTTACDLLSVLLIMYSAHQFEIVNVAMESLVEGAAAEEGADTGKVLALKMLRNKQDGGDYGKVEDVHEEQEDFIEDYQDKMMFYKGGDVQESDLWENNLKNSGTKVTKNMSELHKIVKFHQGLLTNVDKLRLLLEPVIFLHYLMSSAALCLVGYMFTTQEGLNVKLALKFFHLAALLIRLFLLCLFATQVSYQCVQLSEAAYFSDWYCSSRGYKRDLQIVMARAQKPFYFTAGKFGVMSLETYSRLIQTAYSYYALLRKVSED